jgi:hypothetical protein
MGWRGGILWRGGEGEILIKYIFGAKKGKGRGGERF